MFVPFAEEGLIMADARIVSVELYVAYNANGGSGVPNTTVARSSVSMYDFPVTVYATVASGTPTRSGYTFLGWSRMPSATSAEYVAGNSVSHRFTWTGSDVSHTLNLFAIWRQNQYTVSYKKGTYGSGTDVDDTKYGGTDLTLRGAIFTRAGYRQTGWSANASGSPYLYGLGGKYTNNADITLYPYWAVSASTIASVTSSVPANGTTQGTVSINRANESWTHKVVISLGSQSIEYTGVATSQTFTIPAVWVSQIPSSVEALATVTVTTYSGNTQIGSPDSKTFKVTVPSSVVPTVSLSGTNKSSNATVQSWGILVQGYSTIELTATASAGTGSTITSVVFSGERVSQSGTSLTTESDLLTNAGNKTWRVVVTDARGRSSSATLTRNVSEYFTPSVSKLDAYRSDSQGDEAPADGTYISALCLYQIASCRNHNTATVKIEYKLKSSSTWTTAVNNAATNTRYTFGTISPLYDYNVRVSISDSLKTGNKITIVIPSVSGYSFGMNGECVHFGGPILIPDAFECDFRTFLRSDVTIGGRVYASKFMQRDIVSVRSVSAGDVDTIDVSFSTTFDAVPVVVACLYSSQTVGLGDCSCSVYNLTTTGFSLRLENNYSSARDLGATWIAIL